MSEVRMNRLLGVHRETTVSQITTSLIITTKTSILNVDNNRGTANMQIELKWFCLNMKKCS